MLAGHAVAAQAQRARVLRTASSRLPTKRANPPLGLTLHSLDRSDSLNPQLNCQFITPMPAAGCIRRWLEQLPDLKRQC